MELNDKIKIYEGNVETGSLNGMIFSVTADEIKKFNWDFDKFFYNIEGIDIHNIKDVENFIRKLTITRHL